jgi:hypothetical protein
MCANTKLLVVRNIDDFPSSVASRESVILSLPCVGCSVEITMEVELLSGIVIMDISPSAS